MNHKPKSLLSPSLYLDKIDALVKSPDSPLSVIPAKAGHIVKHQRYPVFSNSSGLPFARE